jgi:hypothetical protein
MLNENNLKADFNGILTSRMFTFSMIALSKEKLLEQTQELIKQIESIDKLE